MKIKLFECFKKSDKEIEKMVNDFLKGKHILTVRYITRKVVTPPGVEVHDRIFVLYDEKRKPFEVSDGYNY
jgi:L-lysine 2,3-aminomutase